MAGGREAGRSVQRGETGRAGCKLGRLGVARPGRVLAAAAVLALGGVAGFVSGPSAFAGQHLGSKHSSHLSSGLNLFAIGTTTVTAYRLQLGAAGAS